MVDFEFKNGQSKKNWDQYKFVYLIMFVILIVTVLIFSRLARKQIKMSSSFEEDGDGPALMKGRGSEKDETDVLLDRLEWSTYYESRITRWYRMIVITIIVVALISVLAIRKLPKPATIIALLLTVFIPMISVNNFYYAHADVYNDYYMWKNIQIIRERLYKGEEYQDPGDPHPDAESPDRIQAMNQQ